MTSFKEEKILTSFPRKIRDAIPLAIAFPNSYSIGMASLGFQTAWKLLNGHEEVSVHRWFTDIQEYSGSNPPLYVGFSFSWELDYKNILSMLEKNKIPIHACKRKEEDPLIFSGGQVPNANCEPFIDFFDFFLLGDLEVLAPKLIEKIIEIKNCKRNEKLEELSKVEGIYVPSCKENSFFPSTKKIPTSKNEFAFSSVLTPNSIWPDTFLLEVVRSCPEMCKFCLASFGSLPFRAPKVKETLIPILENALKHTNKIGLLGASVTQHPQFEILLDFLLSHPRMSKVNLPLQVQIASVRADTISKNLAEGLFKLQAKSLTMAVETGSERLRDLINKKVNNETIFKSIQTIYSSGFNSIKLYGMVGLPYEEEGDLKETISFLSEIKKKNKTKKLTWGCSVFVPKAKTPFFIFGVDKNADKKLKFFKKELHKIGVDFREESYKWALIQALISRGDKTIGPILEDAYREGSTLGSFNKAIKKHKNVNARKFIFEELKSDS